jgi:hypothetical protein
LSPNSKTQDIVFRKQDNITTPQFNHSERIAAIVKWMKSKNNNSKEGSKSQTLIEFKENKINNLMK